MRKYIRIDFVTVDGYYDYTNVIDDYEKDLWELIEIQHPTIYDDIKCIIDITVWD